VRVFCGIDWAEAHHDVALVDSEGTLIAKRRISDDAAGFAALITLLADAGDSAEDPLPVAIETGSGLLVACLRATGRDVYAINPVAVSRYRDRYSVARKKSDAGDAFVLANILRTDIAAPPTAARRVRTRPSHRRVGPRPARRRVGTHLRAQQAALAAARVLPRPAGSLHHQTRRPAAPRGAGPARRRPHPPRSRHTKHHSAHGPAGRAGRHRGINTEAARIQAILRTEYLYQLPLVEDAFGRQALALLRALDTAATNAEDLATATIEHFNTHPDAEIITSLPGLGPLTGARVLAEIGDDRSRFTNARALKAYAGAAPVTRASGKSLTVTHRKVKNQRLAAAGYVWAFSALTASPGARTHYDHRKTTRDRHTAAQRHLFNRLLGCLHHCLQTRQHYNEQIAFPPTRSNSTSAAA